MNSDAEIDAGAELAHTRELPDWMKGTKSGVILGQNIRSYAAIGGHVECEGSINDYAAYAAGGRDPEWAYRYGNKISFKEACLHFPGGQLVEERYRR